MLTVALLVLSLSAAGASAAGVFGELARQEGADERLLLLENAAEEIGISCTTEDGVTVEIDQAYYEGNHVYVAYRVLNGMAAVQDGLELENGTYADIIAGDETELEDGSTAGWKECVIPEEEAVDVLTFRLMIMKSFESDESTYLGFTLNRHEAELRLQGASPADSYQARAEVAMGKIDMKGYVYLHSAEQAAAWLAWQEGEEETGADPIGGWTLYQNGEPVSADLYGAFRVEEGTDEIVFEVMFPRMEDLSGLALVPDYTQSGEKPEEAIELGQLSE